MIKDIASISMLIALKYQWTVWYQASIFLEAVFWMAKGNRRRQGSVSPVVTMRGAFLKLGAN